MTEASHISQAPTPRRRVRHDRLRRNRAGRGFTLIEAALTTVIIGVGVLALIEAQQSFLRSNAWSTQAATAGYLANEIREMTRGLPRHDPVTGLYFEQQGGSSVLRGWGVEPGEVDVLDFDDLDDFDGVTLAFNGTAGPEDGDLPGPIDAFGQVIPEILAGGDVMVDQQGQTVPLMGWSQIITVEKVDPFDTNDLLSDDATLPAVPPDFAGLPVDGFPLRVSVTVRYQGPFSSEPTDIATVVWIVP